LDPNQKFLSIRTIYRWAQRGKIPAIKLSRSKRGDWRFDLEQIEKWERLWTTGAMEWTTKLRLKTAEYSHHSRKNLLTILVTVASAR
jgi:Helix-turn-helix domain